MQINSISLVNALFCEVNPSPVKHALNLIGYNFGKPRLPLIEPTEEHKNLIEKELKNFKLTN